MRYLKLKKTWFCYFTACYARKSWLDRMIKASFFKTLKRFLQYFELWTNNFSTDLNQANTVHNPIFVPTLPYDQEICEDLCTTMYLLPQCGCYVIFNAWLYAGSPANVSVCPSIGENCTAYSWQSVPADVIQACECHTRCNSVRFGVVNAEKLSYDYGTHQVN